MTPAIMSGDVAGEVFVRIENVGGEGSARQRTQRRRVDHRSESGSLKPSGKEPSSMADRGRGG